MLDARRQDLGRLCRPGHFSTNAVCGSPTMGELASHHRLLSRRIFDLAGRGYRHLRRQRQRTEITERFLQNILWRPGCGTPNMIPTNLKTLYDTQPGGRLRLGKVSAREAWIPQFRACAAERNQNGGWKLRLYRTRKRRHGTAEKSGGGTRFSFPWRNFTKEGEDRDMIPGLRRSQPVWDRA